MKIKQISCTQFAGIRDRDVSFSDGINVIFGRNESGKSTLVNLLSRTLFQNAKIDGRRDKEFSELFFPGIKKGGKRSGDYADGKVIFETEQGTFAITKEWGADHRCVLSTPDGAIRDASVIADVLKEAMIYGEGVYSELLFSSQRNTSLSLQTLLDASKKSDMKQEITDAVSQAFAESDGLSIDAMEQAIAQKIEEIAGKHWDAARRAPVQNKHWATGLGEILKAYYALEDAQKVLQELQRLELLADRASASYMAADREAAAAEEALHAFQTYAGLLQVRNDRQKVRKQLEALLNKYAEVLSVWPAVETALAQAKVLQEEKQNRELLDRYTAAKAILEQKQALDLSLLSRPCPTVQEIRTAKSALRTIADLENKLCGMNLRAVLTMLNGHEAEIRSLRTGELVDVQGTDVALTEAVCISVPGVMELQLTPADVDADVVSRQITEHQASLTAMYQCFGVDTVEAMEELASQIKKTQTEVEALDHRLSMVLSGADFAQLETAVRQIPEAVRAMEDIDRDILQLCGSRDPERFIAAKETILESYNREYGSEQALKAAAFDTDAEYRKAKAAVESTAEIPEEYRLIADPEAHLERLQQTMKEKQQKREAALTEKMSAVSRLEAQRETCAEDPKETVERAQQHFEDTETLLHHWLHIQQVFDAQKAELHSSPMEDIAARFSHNLALISDDAVSSEFPDAEKLQMKIYSGSNLLDYGKLSEGTKETVSLAFRLAVLDHLFPDGGGVIVLDDPFTDMDADRAIRSCNLLRDCALRHQIIFLTCREDYLTHLPGNVIRF